MKKTLIGTVVSTKMKKAVVVSVERKFRHAKYHKVIIRHKKYKVKNDMDNITQGDVVTIEETRPLSRDMRFRIVKKLDVTS